MKTVRFSKVVERCGKPEVYLALIDPAKDRTLQAAVRAHRIMTVWQPTVGTKTDRGEIGLEPGLGRQFLLFPKALRAFAGCRVVGIKYDLLDSRELPKSQRAPPAKPAKSSRPKAVPPKKEELPSPRKVVAFAPDAEGEEDSEIAEMKKKIRHAMEMLEAGKPVAAFNLLKRIVGD